MTVMIQLELYTNFYCQLLGFGNILSNWWERLDENTVICSGEKKKTALHLFLWFKILVGSTDGGGFTKAFKMRSWKGFWTRLALGEYQVGLMNLVSDSFQSQESRHGSLVFEHKWKTTRPQIMLLWAYLKEIKWREDSSFASLLGGIQTQKL